MTTLEDVVVAAIKQGASTIHIVPDQHVTYVRLGDGSNMHNWKQVDNRTGSALIAYVKQTCDMPVRKDIELSGEGFIYAGARRAILRASSAPYRGDGERVVVRINAS